MNGGQRPGELHGAASCHAAVMPEAGPGYHVRWVATHAPVIASAVPAPIAREPTDAS